MKTLIYHDSSGLVPSAPTIVIPPLSAWCDGKSFDMDRIRRFVAAQKPNADFLFDVENPALLQLSVFTKSMKLNKTRLDQVRKGMDVAIGILRVAQAERPDMGFAFYDALIEDETTIVNAYESVYRETRPRGEKDDLWFVQQKAVHFGELEKLNRANRFLSPLHDAQDLSVARCYFSRKGTHPSQGADVRGYIIDWCWQQALLMANGKPAVLLYKPNCQDGGGRIEHTDEMIDEDIVSFGLSRVTRVCGWRDQISPPDRLPQLAAKIKERSMATAVAGGVS